ncbi:MAG: hypothetical protein WKF67_06425 [Rubrobacteraceae bacterium]
MSSRKSLAQPARDHVLVRVHADGREEPVSEHPDFGSGWQAGTHAVHTDRENAYSLYRGGRRVARFCFNRIAVRHQSFDWSVLS